MLKGHGGNIYELARELNCPPDTIIDMSSNVNPLGPMPEMMDFLREQTGDITRLPEVNAKGIIGLFADAGQIGQHRFEFTADAVVCLAGDDARQVGRDRSDIGGNRHFIVV